jgi:hypothetical protein
LDGLVFVWRTGGFSNDGFSVPLLLLYPDEHYLCREFSGILEKNRKKTAEPRRPAVSVTPSSGVSGYSSAPQMLQIVQESDPPEGSE